MKDEDLFGGVQDGIRNDDFDREKVRRMARINEDKAIALNDTGGPIKGLVDYNQRIQTSLVDQNRIEKGQTLLAQYLADNKSDKT